MAAHHLIYNEKWIPYSIHCMSCIKKAYNLYVCVNTFHKSQQSSQQLIATFTTLRPTSPSIALRDRYVRITSLCCNAQIMYQIIVLLYIVKWIGRSYIKLPLDGDIYAIAMIIRFKIHDLIVFFIKSNLLWCWKCPLASLLVCLLVPKNNRILTIVSTYTVTYTTFC